MTIRMRTVLVLGGINLLFLFLLVMILLREARAGLIIASELPRIMAVGATLLLLSTLSAFLLARRFVIEFRRIGAAAGRIAGGDFDYRSREDGSAEFAETAAAINAMARRLGAMCEDVNRQLSENQMALESTFAHMSEAVAVYDAEGRLLTANDAMVRQFGLPREAIRPGATLDELIDCHAASGFFGGGDEAIELERLCRATRWTGASLSFEIKLPDNRTAAVRRTRLPNGGFISIHEDVTQEREHQRLMRHQAKLATLGEVAATTAHELNQPLNVIRLSADNARARLSSGKAEPAYLDAKLQRISQQTEKAVAIINRMRSLGRRPGETASIIDMSAAVRSAQHFFDETARIHAIAFTADIEADLCILGEASEVEQIVINLLSNAFAAVRDSGRKDRPSVALSLARQGGEAVLEVRDNGGGMPPHVADRVFDPFFTTKGERECSGLGLFISRELVHGMGGRLRAGNSGDGACFHCALPLADGRDRS